MRASRSIVCCSEASDLALSARSGGDGCCVSLSTLVDSTMASWRLSSLNSRFTMTSIHPLLMSSGVMTHISSNS